MHLFGRSLFLLVMTTVPGLAAPPVPPEGVLFQNLCAPCHGPQGQGQPALKAPSIAGLPDWYVAAQLESFRKDRRGNHPSDPEGQLMRQVAKAVPEHQVAPVARHVSQLPRVPPSPSVSPSPDSKVGRELYEERCMECHRYNGEGELVFGSPPLVGLPDWYLISQLKKFQAGHRGAVPEDEFGKKMLLAATYIENDEVLHSLVAYLMELQKPREGTPVQGPGDFGKDDGSGE